MATHSLFCLKIPWTEEPGGLQSMGLQRVGHDGAQHNRTLYTSRSQLNSRWCRGAGPAVPACSGAACGEGHGQSRSRGQCSRGAGQRSSIGPPCFSRVHFTPLRFMKDLH